MLCIWFVCTKNCWTNDNWSWIPRPPIWTPTNKQHTTVQQITIPIYLVLDSKAANLNIKNKCNIIQPIKIPGLRTYEVPRKNMKNVKQAVTAEDECLFWKKMHCISSKNCWKIKHIYKYIYIYGHWPEHHCHKLVQTIESQHHWMFVQLSAKLFIGLADWSPAACLQCTLCFLFIFPFCFWATKGAGNYKNRRDWQSQSTLTKAHKSKYCCSRYFFRFRFSLMAQGCKMHHHPFIHEISGGVSLEISFIVFHFFPLIRDFNQI